MYGIPHLKLQPIQNFEKLATFFSEEVSIKNRVRDFYLKALIVIIFLLLFSEKQYFLLYSCVIFKIFIYKMCHTVLSSSLFLFQNVSHGFISEPFLVPKCVTRFYLRAFSCAKLKQLLFKTQKAPLIGVCQ